MILTTTQISDIILNNPGQKRISKARTYSKKLRRHIYGEGMETFFQQVNGYERPGVVELRNKYSKSNRDLFSRLARPLDKVFTAKGGSLYYNLPDAAEQKARQITQNVKDGYSVRKWVESFWKPHLLDDPNGIIFLEIPPQQEAILLKQQGKSFVLPTYKCSAEIYDYQPKGNRLEWVVFEVCKEDKKALGFKPEDQIYRVVDDAKDYIVQRTNNAVTIFSNAPLTIPNFFGEVPAILNSDIVDPVNEYSMLSVYDEIIELAEEFLLDGSIKRVHKFMHGFPKWAEFASDCPDCKGYGSKGADKCETCKGSGKKAMLRVSDVKLLDFPTKEDPVILPADTGAYISPDKTFFDISSADLSDLENLMSVTMWGTQSRTQTQGMAQKPDNTQRTATEVMDEIKPQADRLTPISEMAEQRHKFILDAVVRLNLGLASYTGASVNYGRRYMLEGPDTIWNKYADARTKGAPQNVLDTLLNEFYEANYQSDSVGLATAKKLMYVEPFVHYTAQQLMGLQPDPNDYKAKLYFSEWLAKQNESVLLVRSVDELKADLATYVKDKQTAQQQQLPAA